jgi:hypothetical protein
MIFNSVWNILIKTVVLQHVALFLRTWEFYRSNEGTNIRYTLYSILTDIFRGFFFVCPGKCPDKKGTVISFGMLLKFGLINRAVIYS